MNIMFFLWVLALSFLCPSYSFAQDDAEPPPSRTVTKEVKDRLAQAFDAKARTKLALTLMTTHLTAAESYNTQSNFDAAFRELGGFEGLLDDTLEFLLPKADDTGRMLDNFKRFDIGLRGFLPRIEAIRRDLPPKYDDYIRTLLKYVRDARSKAVEPLFDDTVVKTRSIDSP